MATDSDTTTTTTTAAGYDLLSYFHEEHNDLLEMAETRTLNQGEVLINEGEPQPGLFIVTRGLLDVRLGQQEPISVGKRGPGDLLGEVSFLTGEGANANVVARETSEVLALPAETLRTQLHQDAQFACRFYQTLSRVVARKLTEQTRRAVPFNLAITHSHELDEIIRCQVHQVKAGLAQLETELRNQTGDSLAAARTKTHEILDAAMEFLRQIFGPDSQIPAVLHQDVGFFLRQEFLPFVLLSRICEHSYTKPRGYAGDYMAIDILYANRPSGVGRLGPLLDEYFLNIPVARAVRNRRGLLVDVFMELLEDAIDEPLHVTSLGCGPAREIFDLFERLDQRPQMTFHCLDLDFQALSTVSRRAEEMGVAQHVQLLQENLILLATGRHEVQIPPQDLMYSIGLIDYFQDKLAVKLLDWIYGALRPAGMVVVGNFDVRCPDRGFMDHLLEWPLIYRTPDDMRRLFASSRFGERPVDIRYEQQGINLFASCYK